MNSRNKIIVVSLVGLAVIAVFLLGKTDLIAPFEGEQAATVEMEDAGELADPDEKAIQEVSPADDPFFAYQEALAKNKPVVLEFYARW